jgi:hypothetical protein
LALNGKRTSEDASRTSTTKRRVALRPARDRRAASSSSLSIEPGLLGLQRLARGRDIRPTLFGCREDFFEGDLVAVVEVPHRAYRDIELLSRADCLERRIELLGNEIEQPFLMRLERRAAVMTSAGLVFDVARRRSQVEPTHRGRSRHVEQARSFPPGFHPPRPMQPQARASRSFSPPLQTEQPESDLRARWNPLWPFRLVPNRRRSSSAILVS